MTSRTPEYRTACRRRILIGFGIHAVAGIIALAGQPLVAFWGLNAAWALGIGSTLLPNDPLFGSIKRRTGLPKKIWITIDDGPDPETTPVLLDLLSKHQRSATFFLIGERAVQHPDLVRSICDAGHEVANHTQTHPQGRVWAHRPKRIWEEIAIAQATLQEITGIVPRHLRAPVGHTNPFVHPAAEELGLLVTGWTARGYDAVETDVDKILTRIRKTLHPGGTLLIHDAVPHAPEVLEKVLEEIALIEEPEPTAACTS